MISSTLSRVSLAIALTAICSAAAAQDNDLPLIEFSAAAASAPAAQTDEQLATLSGGRDTHTTIALTEQDLTAVNTGNRISANTVGSGAISLQDNALSGFSGIGNFVMNTGHNNNLQSSMSVTIIVTH